MKNHYVLDFSSRLPGPYATDLLTHYQVQVIKVISSTLPDPFLDEGLKALDPTFEHWSNCFQVRKIFLYLGDKEQNEFIDNVKNARIAIFSNLNSWERAHGITLDWLRKVNPNLQVIHLKSNKNELPAHDINLLAEAGILFQYHLGETENFSLPPLPWAGIIFSHHIALKALSLLAQEETNFQTHEIFFSECIDQSLRPFSQHLNYKGLNRGKFPCYNLYKLRDGKMVALAAVEEKYWQKFCYQLQLKFDSKDRFDTSGLVFEELKSTFSHLTSEQLTELLEGNSICLTIY